MGVLLRVEALDKGLAHGNSHKQRHSDQHDYDKRFDRHLFGGAFFLEEGFLFSFAGQLGDSLHICRVDYHGDDADVEYGYREASECYGNIGGYQMLMIDAHKVGCKHKAKTYADGKDGSFQKVAVIDGVYKQTA